MVLISMYKDFGTHMNGVVLRDASAALAIVARRMLGKLRHLDTNYLWIQEKAAGDLNFKKVAGVDNGADLFTKTLSRNGMQSHIHKVSSQFIQYEINVNYVGARPNGVNLPQVLQELGVARGRNLAAWTRTWRFRSRVARFAERQRSGQKWKCQRHLLQLWKVRSFSQVLLCKRWKSKRKGKKGDSKGWSDSKGWTVGKGWSEGKGWNI